MPQTFAYGDSTSQVGDLYLPAARVPAPVVCLLHGGFWKMPYGREEMADVAADLAARGYAVWNIEYRRVGAPGGGWPGTLEDVAAAIDHLAALGPRAADLDLERVAVVGHSAGGHLAFSASARGIRAGRPLASSRVTPIAACGQAAVSDLQRAHALNCGNGAVPALLGGSPDRYPDRYALASPIRLAPLGVRQLILHGTLDDAVPVELAREFVEVARRAGDEVDYVELPAMGHMEYLDPTSHAHAVLCSWLDSVLANAGI